MEEENKAVSKAAAVWAFIKKIAVRVWKYVKIARMELIIMIGFFLIDLISKIIVKNVMPVGSSGRVTVIPFVLNFVYIQNKDAAFGSNFIVNLFGGSEMGARIFFSVFAVAASVGIMLYLIHCRGRHRVLRASLALFIAGAMGNCIDRMAYGYVVDFIELVYFGLTIFGRKTFYVFNIADSALVIGVLMLLVYFIFMNNDKDAKRKAAADGSGTDADAADLAKEATGETDGSGEQTAADAKATDSGEADGGGSIEKTASDEAMSDGYAEELPLNERIVDPEELLGGEQIVDLPDDKQKTDSVSGDKG